MLGHWLGLATRAPSDLHGPVGADSEAPEGTVERVYIPSISSPAFPCMRLLHRFLALLETVLGTAIHTLDAITDELAEAVGGFLEMLRPRSLPVSLVHQLLRDLSGKRPDTCRMLATAAHDLSDTDTAVIRVTPP